MRLRPMIAALSVCAGVLAALPAAARPYLLLSADNTGFQALDLGDFVRTPASPYPEDRVLRPAETGPEAAPSTPERFGAAGPRLRDSRTEGVLGAGEGAARIAPRAAAHPLFVPDRVEATLISAPLAGAPYGDKQLAPLVKQRVEFDCREPRWRVSSQIYADAHEVVLAAGPAPQAWMSLDEDSAASRAQAALCRRQFRQAAVSRFLNVGEILANYQAAHSAAAPQPPTREQLLAERYKRSR
jgi:hypothetical protein